MIIYKIAIGPSDKGFTRLALRLIDTQIGGIQLWPSIFWGVGGVGGTIRNISYPPPHTWAKMAECELKRQNAS